LPVKNGGERFVKIREKNVQKGWILLFLFILLAVLAAGCGKKKVEESRYSLFYLNNQKTKIVSMAYEPTAVTEDGLIDEFLEMISTETNSVDYRKVFPEAVKIERYEYVDSQLYLYFNKAYNDMASSEEVLCRGAIVHTLMQIEGVSGIVFYVDNQPLTDANGVEVGMMTNDSFVDNPGEKINSIQEADIVLYFASQTGDGLVKETQHVYYSSNISTEKLVMERLLEGPESENARASIPSGTGLISVSVMDGVCFVNLDENFLVQNYEIREDVIIYSIVDSLTELSTVDTVQISVNGETNLVYRDKMSLTDYYRRNLELVTEDGENVEINQQEEKEGFLDSGQ
jgi:germination protein M